MGKLLLFGSKWYDGIIGSIPCGRIECITASVPPALIVPFNSDLEIYPPEAVMHSIRPHGIDPIIPSYHLLPKRRSFANSHALTD